MKTFGDLKVGDIIFSKAKGEDMIMEHQIEEISFMKDLVSIKFSNQWFYISFHRDAKVHITSGVTYFANKNSIIPGLKEMIKDLKYELQTCEQLLREYESESKIAK